MQSILVGSVKLLIGCMFALLMIGSIGSANASESDPYRGIQVTIFTLEDPRSRLSLEEVLSESPDAWQRLDRSELVLGYSASRWWVRVDVWFDAAAISDRIFEIQYSALDHLKLHLVDQSPAHLVAAPTTFSAGYLDPFLIRPIHFHRPAFPVSLKPGDNRLYFEIKSRSAIQLPIAIHTPQQFWAYQLKSSLLNGMFFGGMGVMVLFNILLSQIVRSGAYLLYGAYLFVFTLFLAQINGWLFQYLWPQQPNINRYAHILLLGLSMVFSTRFVMVFLNLRYHQPRLQLILQVLLGSQVLLTFLLMMFDSRLLLQAGVGLIVLTCVAALLVGFYAVKQQWYGAGYYLAAWITLLLAAMVVALNRLGILGSAAVGDAALQVGIILQVILIALALAEKINQEKSARVAAESDWLQLEERLSNDLARQVKAQTRALEATQSKLKRMSSTDPLTGLCNRRQLDQELSVYFSAAKQNNSSFCVTLVDIDHFKMVNDRYGHLAGDHCLREVARILFDLASTSQAVVARFGGEEFLLYCHQLGPDAMVQLATKVLTAIAATPVKFNAETIVVTASVGVGFCHACANTELETIIHAADQALYAAKAGGRNRIECRNTANSTSTISHPKRA